MDKKIECLRCNSPMEFIGSNKIQLGERGMPFSHIISGALKVDIHFCKECGKLEFFHTKGELLTKTQCPSCGKSHDRDYRKCPFCKYDYSLNEK